MTAALTPPLPMIMNRMWPRDVIAATVRAGISVATGYFASPYRKSVENACRDVQVPCWDLDNMLWAGALSTLSHPWLFGALARDAPARSKFRFICLASVSIQNTKHLGGAHEVLLGPF